MHGCTRSNSNIAASATFSIGVYHLYSEFLVDALTLSPVQLAPPGASFQPSAHPPPVAHLHSAPLHTSSTLAGSSSLMGPGVSGGSDVPALRWLQQLQAGGQRAALLNSMIPAAPHHPRAPHSMLLGTVPGATAAHATTPVPGTSQAQYQQSAQESQPQAVPAPGSPDARQLLHTCMQVQVLSYMAAMAGLNPWQMPQPPLSQSSEPLSAQQQAALNVQQAQLAEIEQRALQAGVLAEPPVIVCRQFRVSQPGAVHPAEHMHGRSSCPVGTGLVSSCSFRTGPLPWDPVGMCRMHAHYSMLLNSLMHARIWCCVRVQLPPGGSMQVWRRHSARRRRCCSRTGATLPTCWARPCRRRLSNIASPNRLLLRALCGPCPRPAPMPQWLLGQLAPRGAHGLPPAPTNPSSSSSSR